MILPTQGKSLGQSLWSRSGRSAAAPSHFKAYVSRMRTDLRCRCANRMLDKCGSPTHREYDYTLELTRSVRQAAICAWLPRIATSVGARCRSFCCLSSGRRP
eukprot:359498-Chlamydomonas_euryale.AAC.7